MMVNQKNLIFLIIVLVFSLFYATSLTSSNQITGAVVTSGAGILQTLKAQTSTTCGNGIIDPGESCDPGNSGAWGKDIVNCNYYAGACHGSSEFIPDQWECQCFCAINENCPAGFSCVYSTDLFFNICQPINCGDDICSFGECQSCPQDCAQGLDCHYGCNSNSCQNLDGSGSDTCSSNSQCYALGDVGLANADSTKNNKFIVGAHGFNNNIGKIYLYSGATGNLLWEKEGETYASQFGFGVSSVPDVNGDKKRDFVVGSPKFLSSPGFLSGKIYVYSGKTHDLLWSKEGEYTLSYFGEYISGVPDVDGDGFGDIAVGAVNVPNGVYTGKIYLYSGATGNLLWEKYGEFPFDLFGVGVTGMGDVNGDVAGDILVSSYDFKDTNGDRIGKIYLYSGATGNLLWEKEGVMGEGFGKKISGVPDLNGDGLWDVVVNAGSISKFYVYSGANGDLLWSKVGEKTSIGFASRMSGIQDLNGDFSGDILVSSPWFDGIAGQNTGKIYLYSGKNGRLIWSKEGEIQGENLGWYDAEVIGDSNNDGVLDILVPTSKNNINILSGVDGKVLKVIEGDPSVYFGKSITGFLK